MCDDDKWVAFLDTLVKVMTKFEGDPRFSIYDAHAKMEQVEAGIDPEIVVFIHNTISEIDGFPDGYSEVLALATKKASQRVFKIYMLL